MNNHPKVRLTVDLTKYHPSLVVGTEGVDIGEWGMWSRNFDRFTGVRFPETTLDVLLSSLEVIREPELSQITSEEQYIPTQPAPKSSISNQNGKPGLSFVMLLHNGEKIKYPWRKGIKSVLPVADDIIVVLAGPHEDDTEKSLGDFALSLGKYNRKVTVVTGEESKHLIGVGYVLDPRIKWPEKHTGLSTLVNIGTEYANTKWAVQIQADEIFDENDYEELLRLPKLSDNYMAASFGFRHFCGDFFHTFPFVYERVIRAYRLDSDYHFGGDAVQAEGHGDVYSANIVVNHVGKVHVGREEAAAFKEFMFQSQLYSNGKCWEGDVDPKVRAAYEKGKLDFFEVFGDTVKRGDVKEYGGPWCKYVREWAHELGIELP